MASLYPHYIIVSLQWMTLDVRGHNRSCHEPDDDDTLCLLYLIQFSFQHSIQGWSQQTKSASTVEQCGLID